MAEVAVAVTSIEQELAARLRRHPEAVARWLVGSDIETSRRLAQELERQLMAEPLARIERVWDLSASQTAALFGVSRQAYAKWKAHSVPADRLADVAALAEATSQLLAHVMIDRIPAVVRRASSRHGGRCLIDIATAEGAAAVLRAVTDTFDLARVQP